MSVVDELLEKLLKADDQLGTWYRAMDKEWERLKAEHNSRAGNPYGFTAHLEEMSKQAMASVKEDPRPQVFPVLDEVADAFLKVSPEERSALSDFFADCRYLERIHRGYVSTPAAEQLRSTREVAWLWRGIAVAAMGQGGTDYRDLHLALADLWKAAQAAGLDPGLAFRQVGAFGSAKPGRGGLNGSIREFLVGYTA